MAEKYSPRRKGEDERGRVFWEGRRGEGSGVGVVFCFVFGEEGGGVLWVVFLCVCCFLCFRFFVCSVFVWWCKVFGMRFGSFGACFLKTGSWFFKNDRGFVLVFV